LSFEDVRNMTPVMLGQRRLQDFCFRPAEMLFDMERDPLEVVDLAQDPAYADLMKEMRAKTETWQWETEDIWLFKDGQSIRGLVAHLADDRMVIPDRFDFEPSRPGNKGDKTMECVVDPNFLVRGGALYAGKSVGVSKAKAA
jgi:N-sulfoglucosamine sulfohydrolase